jgi:hypothetical protein
LKLDLSIDFTGVTFAATFGAQRDVFFIAARLLGEAALTFAEIAFFFNEPSLGFFLVLPMIIFRPSEFQST